VLDLLPTILDFAGLPPPTADDIATGGRSLLPILRGENPSTGLVWRSYLYTEMSYHGPDIYRPARAVRDRSYRLIRTYPPFERGVGGLMLFDLERDPRETVNCIDDPAYAEVLARLIDRLDRWQVRTDDLLAGRR
jgi:arylsulfatase A-like enzyme